MLSNRVRTFRQAVLWGSCVVMVVVLLSLLCLQVSNLCDYIAYARKVGTLYCDGSCVGFVALVVGVVFVVGVVVVVVVVVGRLSERLGVLV